MSRKRTKPRTIDEAFLSELRSTLAEGQPFKARLPFSGRLHIERNLPCLLVYRVPTAKPDPMAGRLITIDTFRLLHREHGFEERASFRTTLRVHRAGGFTKDHIYFRGPISILDYLARGGNLETVLVGKMARRHVSFICEPQHGEVLRPPPVLPRFLNSSTAAKRLRKVERGLRPVDLASAGR